MMHLNAHLDETKQSQAGFGATLRPPASQSLVSQWINGTTRVTLAYAIQIDRETEGRVSFQDCADMYLGPTSATVQVDALPSA